MIGSCHDRITDVAAVPRLEDGVTCMKSVNCDWIYIFVTLLIMRGDWEQLIR